LRRRYRRTSDLPVVFSLVALSDFAHVLVWRWRDRATRRVG